MARGVSDQAQSLATTATNAGKAQAQQNSQQQAAQQAQSQALLSQYQNLANNGGYTDAQKSAVTNSTMGSLGATYDALRNSAALNAARTRNDASYTAGLDSLARTQGEQAADLAAKNEVTFANAARQDRNLGIQGQASLYGVNQDALNRALGLPVNYYNAGTSALNAATNANANSFGNTFLKSLGQGLGSGLGSRLTSRLKA